VPLWSSGTDRLASGLGRQGEEGKGHATRSEPEMRDSASRVTRPDGHSLLAYELCGHTVPGYTKGKVPLLHHKLPDARGTCHERGRFWSQQGTRESVGKISTPVIQLAELRIKSAAASNGRVVNSRYPAGPVIQGRWTM
jgi:hypothetical protein